MPIDTRTNSYAFLFALAVCAVSSFTLAAVSQVLKPRQEFNASMDVKRSILKAARLNTPLPAGADNRAVDAAYQTYISETSADGAGKLPLYIYREDGADVAYVFPVQGPALWSTVYGYLALEADAITVRGVSFYKHGETPGLGGEIEKEFFQNSFRGKKVWDMVAAKLRPVGVAKGKAADRVHPDELAFWVDGISGATLTGNGVTALLAKGLGAYEPYFSGVRARHAGAGKGARP